MSGGSYDYAYLKIEDLANNIRITSSHRKAFKAHLLKVAKACHDIEWVDSQDYGTGDENEAILACLGPCASGLVLKEVVDEANRVKAELDEAIKAADVFPWAAPGILREGE